jgi:hypothetical protein
MQFLSLFPGTQHIRKKRTKDTIIFLSDLAQQLTLLDCFQEVPGLKHWLLWLRLFMVYLSPSRQMLWENMKVGHCCCLPHPSNSLFTIISLFSTDILSSKLHSVTALLDLLQTNITVLIQLPTVVVVVLKCKWVMDGFCLCKVQCMQQVVPGKKESPLTVHIIKYVFNNLFSKLFWQNSHCFLHTTEDVLTGQRLRGNYVVETITQGYTVSLYCWLHTELLYLSF